MAAQYLYAVTVACPNCRDETTFINQYDNEAPVDQDIDIGASHCPECGHQITPGEWDLVEEKELGEPAFDPDASIELGEEHLDAVLDTLETAMRHCERALSHDEVRLSTYLLAKKTKRAYQDLVDAHPDYTLSDTTEGDS